MEILTDRFGRQVRYLRVSVTDRCNLRCVYCLPPKATCWLPREELLSVEEIAQVVAAGARGGITHVRVTGGEPLVREGIVDLAARLTGIPGLTDLSLTTNGLLLSRYAKDLACAGLRRVNVSLDTVRPDRFRQITRFGRLEQVLEGIEAALQAGLHPVKLNVVVMRGVNDDEIVQMARLACERPLHIRFIELMPIGEYFTRERLVTFQEILERLTAVGPLEPAAPAAGCGPARTFRWAGAMGTVGIIGAVTQAFCAGCNRLRLTASGQLRPCLDDDSAIDLKEALRPRIDPGRLAQLIRQAVAAKPEMHGMARRETGSARLCMAGVGG